MAQFDIYRNRAASKGQYPFLLDVQSDILTGLQLRVVVPLAKQSEMRGPLLRGLLQVLDVNGVPLVMLTPMLAAIDRASLSEPVASALPQRAEIIAALDMLFTGA